MQHIEAATAAAERLGIIYGVTDSPLNIKFVMFV